MLSSYEMWLIKFLPDDTLNVPLRWFTGKEWDDGTATKQFEQDYHDHLIEGDYVDHSGNLTEKGREILLKCDPVNFGKHLCNQNHSMTFPTA